MSRLYIRVFVFAALAAMACAGVLTVRISANDEASQAGGPTTIDPVVLGALTWRSVGPDPGTQVRSGDATRGRGGRSITISGVRGRPNEGYFGAVGGDCGRRPTGARRGYGCCSGTQRPPPSTSPSTHAIRA